MLPSDLSQAIAPRISEARDRVEVIALYTPGGAHAALTGRTGSRSVFLRAAFVRDEKANARAWPCLSM